MKKHLVEPNTVDLGFTACGAIRLAMEPREETTVQKRVTCKNCKRILKERKVK